MSSVPTTSPIRYLGRSTALGLTGPNVPRVGGGLDMVGRQLTLGQAQVAGSEAGVAAVSAVQAEPVRRRMKCLSW